MKGILLKYIVLVLLPLALFCSCKKNEQSVEEVSGKVTSSVPFTATVNGTPETRASVSGDTLGEGCYIFETGDKLYVEYKDNNSIYKVYGVLNLVEGAGTGSAVFTGDLNCLDYFTIVDGETTLSATLVGSSAASDFFSFSDLDDDSVNDVVSDVTYPSVIEYASLANLVRRYSHFTGSTTFSTSGNTFTLTQQSVFVSFCLTYFRKNALTNSSAETVSVFIKNSDETEDIHTVSNVPIGQGPIENAIFWTVLEPETNLAGAKMFVQNIEFDGFPNNLSALAANSFYNVHRTLFDGLRIQAIDDGTEITLKYTSSAAGLIEYSTDQGITWISYTSKTPIPLEANQEMWLRGTRTAYTGTSSEDYPQFISTNQKDCYAYGDLMSLLCDADWIPAQTLGQETLQRLFKPAKNLPSVNNEWLVSHDSKTLRISATTVGNSSCKQMFMGCTKLTKSPIDRLPATNLNGTSQCYAEMFRNCSSMTTAPILMAGTLGASSYLNMFNGCSSLNSVTCLATININTNSSTSNWMSGVSASGTFCKDPNATWPRSGHGIPSGWTVTNYVESTP